MSQENHECDGQKRLWGIAFLKGQALNGKPVEVVHTRKEFACCSEAIHSLATVAIAMSRAMGKEIDGVCYRVIGEVPDPSSGTSLPTFPKLSL